ncbi:hypothetical protein OG462_31760 [Streptomyces sp. NBC_01077]|uniref:hypothetical protein n=1 Tax=Streptomyces sp. NBC_01077 TaxID=2903746 RepID=UPI0038708A3F|nr:hypothetical protein OG462_31760 [Streptomyces sp. NBC_01077]
MHGGVRGAEDCGVRGARNCGVRVPVQVRGARNGLVRVPVRVLGAVQVRGAVGAQGGGHGIS